MLTGPYSVHAGVPRCAGQVGRAGGLSSAGGRVSSVVVRAPTGCADVESETPGLAAIGGRSVLSGYTGTSGGAESRKTPPRSP